MAVGDSGHRERAAGRGERGLSVVRRAFARGLDEVLYLKPVFRFLARLAGRMSPPTAKRWSRDIGTDRRRERESAKEASRRTGFSGPP